eukprot:2444562-Rhodomonas_salina.2
MAYVKQYDHTWTYEAELDELVPGGLSEYSRRHSRLQIVTLSWYQILALKRISSRELSTLLPPPPSPSAAASLPRIPVRVEIFPARQGGGVRKGKESAAQFEKVRLGSGGGSCATAARSAAFKALTGF